MSQDSEPNKQECHGQDKFLAQISDESFNFREEYFPDRKVTGLQVARKFGVHPAEEFVILQWMESFELETIRLDELIDLSSPAKIFVIKGSETYRFVIDGLDMEWPLPRITGLNVKRLLGKENEDVEVILERKDIPDQHIEDVEFIKLDEQGLERLKIASLKISIIVNARPREVNKKQLSFDEIVHLAFESAPVGPNISYTITYRRGPVNNPEGEMQQGSIILIKKGMIFNVTATNKS